MNRVAAAKWLKQALHDLEMAGRNVGIGGYDTAAFLAHQSVEKLLKALLAAQGRAVPKTHFIDELAGQLDLPPEVQVHIDGLTADYMLSRYPDVSDQVPYEQYDEALANEKVRAARSVFALLKERYADLMPESRDD
ncbi:MAG: HEPN domain-containing protein [candidate division WOR-3 bacterium]|nr:HEPN domain-containing protein [candidate division WOR-3 bacterium]